MRRRKEERIRGVICIDDNVGFIESLTILLGSLHTPFKIRSKDKDDRRMCLLLEEVIRLLVLLLVVELEDHR